MTAEVKLAAEVKLGSKQGHGVERIKGSRNCLLILCQSIFENQVVPAGGSLFQVIHYSFKLY